ncbi:MAG: ABC transporter ATP-binding protein [Bryobacteraceae bacterium]
MDARHRGLERCRLAASRRNVSTVFQNYALFPHLSVEDNIAFGLRRRGSADTRRPVREMLEMLKLTGKERRLPAQLSGGERQRVALARSLVLAPDILLLDEPLSALDPDLRKQVRSELKSLQRRVGITFLFVTHDQEEALSLSGHIAVMNRGRVEQIGTPEEVYLRPGTRFVASFLGRINWIDGIGVRPEALHLTRGIPSAEMRSRPATVLGATFLGNCIHVEARCETGEALIVEIPRVDCDFRAGEPVHVCWRPAEELRFPDEPS